MYWFKQFIGAMANPLAIATCLALLALLAHRMRWHRSKAVFMGSGVLIAYFGALVPVGDALLRPLERQFPAGGELSDGVAAIVVLGSGYAPRPGVPISGAFDEEGLARVVESVRLARQLPGARLVLTGGAPAGRAAPARGYALLAGELGIARERMTVLDGALDTAQEARDIAKLLGAQPFLLVTSAAHMPRAMRELRMLGAHPTAASTLQRVVDDGEFSLYALVPSSLGLRKTERAIHEYLGLALAAMRGN